MKRARRHHIVPKVLQRSFCNPDGLLWYTECGEEGRFLGPELRSPKGCFWKRDYYAILDGEKLSDVVEQKFYGKIDDYLGKVIPQVLTSFAKGIVPVFEGDALQSMRKIVFEMIKRTPDFVNEADDLSRGREVVQDTLRNRRNLSAEDVSILQGELECDITLRNIGRDVRIQGMLLKSEKVELAMSEFQIKWAKIEDKSSFIVSSQMAYRIGNGGPNGLINPNMEIWMPVSPKISMVFLREKSREIPLVYEETRDHVRQVNLYAKENSYAVASHSKELVQSLIRNR